MLFNSFGFWGFFGVVLAAVVLAPARASRPLLVLASFLFYAAWDARLVLLLGGCVAFNFQTGLMIAGARPPRARAWMIVAVTANLCLLGLFKYYDFFLGTVTALSGVPTHRLLLEAGLPIAISFYTFEAIAYNVDVYRRDVPARTSLVDFALFMSFFPHLIAGPIIRPENFFPQLRAWRPPDATAIRWATVQVVKGLIKKAVFADNFAAIANNYFGVADNQGAMSAAWVATIAFSMQIYFDFSGYTDIARGCARLLGYAFASNFERPYLSAGIGEFWRRWHISLSTWLRDYLYVPLGGSRAGRARTHANLLVTMGLGGLWHGASWNFLVWGLYHGALLSVGRSWRGRAPPGALGHAMHVCGTFALVTLGWITFRTSDLAETWRVLGDIFGGTLQGGVPTAMPVLLVAMTAWLAADRRRRLQAWLIEGRGALAGVARPLTLALALLILELFAQTDAAVRFIYFRF